MYLSCYNKYKSNDSVQTIFAYNYDEKVKRVIEILKRNRMLHMKTFNTTNFRI